MKRTKILISSIISLVLISGSLIGCSKGNETGTSGKADGKTEAKLKVRYVVPGSDQPDQQKVVDAVNQKMAADGVNLELEVKHIGWDAWSNKTNVMLSSGEEFELMHVMENGVPTGVYAGRDAIIPLDDLINEHAPNLKALFPQNAWDAVKVNGKTYSIPDYWRDATQIGGEIGTVTIRTDLLEKNNLKKPATVEELINVGTKLKEVMGKDVYAWDHDINRTPVWLHRSYDTWPFYVDFTDSIVYVDEQGNVKSWYETEEFKKDAETYRKMYKAGLIHPDILSVPKDTRSKMGSEGNYLFGLGTYNTSDQVGLSRKIPDVKLDEFQLYPDKVNYAFLPLLNSNAVPSTTEHPEAGIKFLNWLYSDQKNHDLFLFGIENEHYKLDENKNIEYIKDPATDKNKYAFDFWQIGYYKWTKFQKGTPESYIKAATTTDENAKKSIVTGFAFNSEPVKTEYTNVLSEIPNVIYPIKMGVVDYEKAYPDAIKQLKAAGLDKVVEEYRKQFEEWLKTKK